MLERSRHSAAFFRLNADLSNGLGNFPKGQAKWMGRFVFDRHSVVGSNLTTAIRSPFPPDIAVRY